MSASVIKITESVRSAALRRPLKPAVIRDSEIPGLCLIISSRRGFWALGLSAARNQPRHRQALGRRNAARVL
jgi:hypothetical protein